MATAIVSSDYGVKIQPALVEQSVDPGQTLNLSLQVTNLDASTKTYYFSTQDITSLSPSGQPVFSTSSQLNQFGLSSWVVLSQKSVKRNLDRISDCHAANVNFRNIGFNFKV